MSRAAQPAFPRVGSAASKQDTEDGVDIDRVHQVRTTVAKTGVQKPSGVPSSVFDQVPKTPRKPRRYDPLPDVSELVIENGVAIPPAKKTGFKDSPAALLLERMLPGQSVVLSEVQARTLRTNARKLKVPVLVRNIGKGQARVWRLENDGKPQAAAR